MCFLNLVLSLKKLFLLFTAKCSKLLQNNPAFLKQRVNNIQLDRCFEIIFTNMAIAMCLTCSLLELGIET